MDNLLDVFLTDLDQKSLTFRAGGRYLFGSFFALWPVLFARSVFEDPLAHFGILLVQFWLFFVICAAPFGIENIPFRHPDL